MRGRWRGLVSGIVLRLRSCWLSWISGLRIIRCINFVRIMCRRWSFGLLRQGLLLRLLAIGLVKQRRCWCVPLLSVLILSGFLSGCCRLKGGCLGRTRSILVLRRVLCVRLFRCWRLCCCRSLGCGVLLSR